MCKGSAVEVSANGSEIQICATERSFFSKWLMPTVCKIPPPIPQRGSDLSEADGARVECGLKTATNSLTVLPLRNGSVLLSASELARDCLGKWSMVEAMPGLCLPSKDKQLPSWSSGALNH